MILFCIALPQEMKIIKQEVKRMMGGSHIDFLLTGVGVLNTIYSIKNYIDTKGKPDFIVNIGVCGKINTTVDNFFQVYRIKKLSNQKEVICPLYVESEKKYSIACSDTIVTDTNILTGESFVDMESFGIDYICEKEHIAYIIIKKPFDIIGQKSKHVEISDLENTMKGYDYQKLIIDIESFVINTKTTPYQNSLFESISQKKRLTFSEKELLKKYINKCIAFGEKEENIFKRLGVLEKKDIQKLIK